MIKENCQHIGSVSRTHGIKGELLISTDNEIDNKILKAELVFLIIDGLPVPFFVSSLRQKTDSSLIVKLENLDDTLRAEQFVGVQVGIPVKKKSRKNTALPENDNEFIGYSVTDTHYGALGTIDEIIKYPGNPLLQVKQGKKEILIPIHEDVILNIDDNNKCILVQCPEGLLDL